MSPLQLWQTRVKCKGDKLMPEHNESIWLVSSIILTLYKLYHYFFKVLVVDVLCPLLAIRFPDSHQLTYKHLHLIIYKIELIMPSII